MTAPNTLVDDMVTNLQGITLTTPHVIAKRMSALSEREDDFDSPSAYVWSGEEVWEKASRGGVFIRTYSINVGVGHPVGEDDDAVVDAFFVAVEEIKNQIKETRVGNLPCTGIEQPRPFNTEWLADAGMYFTTITFQFKAIQ